MEEDSERGTVSIPNTMHTPNLFKSHPWEPPEVTGPELGFNNLKNCPSNCSVGGFVQKAGGGSTEQRQWKSVTDESAPTETNQGWKWHLVWREHEIRNWGYSNSQEDTVSQLVYNQFRAESFTPIISGTQNFIATHTSFYSVDPVFGKVHFTVVFTTVLSKPNLFKNQRGSHRSHCTYPVCLLRGWTQKSRRQFPSDSCHCVWKKSN